MSKIIHPMAGVLAILTIATFWLSTAFAELFGSQAVVTTVKTAIPWGFLLLIPALAAAGRKPRGVGPLHPGAHEPNDARNHNSNDQ